MKRGCGRKIRPSSCEHKKKEEEENKQMIKKEGASPRLTSATHATGYGPKLKKSKRHTKKKLSFASPTSYCFAGAILLMDAVMSGATPSKDAILIHKMSTESPLSRPSSASAK